MTDPRSGEKPAPAPSAASPARGRFDIPGMDSVRIPKRAAKALLWGLALYGLACAGMFSAQRSLLYHPMAAPSNASGVLSEAGSARYWLTPASASPSASPCAGKAGAPDGAVAYFGGNAEPASQFGSRAKELPGCALYALDYPGYEGAPGAPTQESIDQAADAMMEAIVRDGHPRSSILLIGRSLGSGEAVRQASLAPCRLAILLTPYDSMASVASDRLPWLPSGPLTLDKFPADEWARSARCDASILYADGDPVIPGQHAFALAKAWSRERDARVSSNPKATHGNIADLAATWSFARGEIAAH